MTRKLYIFFKDFKNSFPLISILLSIISINAGFHYYRAQFGIGVALTTSFTFEVLRLTSLFGIFRSAGKTRTVSIVLYIFAALVCISASLVSFRAWIADGEKNMHNQYLKYYKNEIENIRSAQAKAMKEEIAKNRRAIKICKTNIARNYRTDYFTKRLKQRLQNESAIRSYYDSLMSYIPQKNIYAWIQKEYSEYAMKLNKPVYNPGDYDQVNQSIQAIYHVNASQAKNISMVIIVIGIELGIFLLVLLSENYEEIEPERRALMPAIRRFGEAAIENFIHTCREYYLEHRRFPKPNELSRKNREIRKYIVGRKREEKSIINLIFSLDS